MITPITRKELYLAKIIGEDVDIPETAKTREELFFKKILDNSSKIPEPITREELFLAKISGQNVELPEPKTRLELFLAKAAGVEIETPVPITREEIYWSNYTAIVEFELEGVPPLTFNAVEGALKNYRIYGNTVDGESVGDRTGNLFDGEFLQGYWAEADGRFNVSSKWISTKKIPCKTNVQYTFSSSFLSRWAGFYWYDENDNYLSSNTAYNITLLTETSPLNAAYMAINIAGYPTWEYTISPSDVTDFMLVEGSTPLPYEPYGYRVPVTVKGKNLFDFDTFKAHVVGAVDGGKLEWGDNSLTLTAATNDSHTFPYNGSDDSYRMYVKPSTSYTLSFNKVNSSRIMMFENGLVNSEHWHDVNFINRISYSFTTRSDTTFITIRFGLTLKGVTGTFSKIQFELGAEATDYEPYHTPITTNFYLPEPLAEGESISMSDTEIVIPTISGTNILSVDTTVQPSRVNVKGKIQRI